MRQGDSLSPSLFNIVGEVFHILMEKANRDGLVEGVKTWNNLRSISHLQFADDTIVFLKPSLENIINLNRILQCFQIVSGLKINFGKSSLYGWNEPDLQNWAAILGCRVGSLPINSLGTYIGISPRKKLFWKPLLERFDSKLVAWRKNSLNQAGRRVLIKACLNSLPSYWFHMHRIPVGIIKLIDKKMNNFFWGGKKRNGEEVNKLHLVNWKSVCNPTHKGGLGLDNISSRNSAMLLKWWWKWFSERGGLWWNIVQKKYQLCSHLGLDQCTNLSNMSYIMKDICSPYKIEQGFL